MRKTSSASRAIRTTSSISTKAPIFCNPVSLHHRLESFGRSGQRCRVVVGSNPPTTAEGLWVIRHWAPWLDPVHPRPAVPGELRWFTTAADGEDIEVEGRGPHPVNGEPILARSRTYIPARLADNPDLSRTGYAAVLAGLPEELRRAYRDGNFAAGAQGRRFPGDPHRLDRGGPAALARRRRARRCHDGDRPRCRPRRRRLTPCWRRAMAAGTRRWCASPATRPATAARSPPRWWQCAATAARWWSMSTAAGAATPWRGSRITGFAVVGFQGANASSAQTRDRQLTFFNKRAEAWWRMREELDPGQDGGSILALPPDASIKADLAAPRWELTPAASRSRTRTRSASGSAARPTKATPS